MLALTIKSAAIVSELLTIYKSDKFVIVESSLINSDNVSSSDKPANISLLIELLHTDTKYCNIPALPRVLYK